MILLLILIAIVMISVIFYLNDKYIIIQAIVDYKLAIKYINKTVLSKKEINYYLFTKDMNLGLCNYFSRNTHRRIKSRELPRSSEYGVYCWRIPKINTDYQFTIYSSSKGECIESLQLRINFLKSLLYKMHFVSD